MDAERCRRGYRHNYEVISMSDNNMVVIINKKHTFVALVLVLVLAGIYLWPRLTEKVNSEARALNESRVESEKKREILKAIERYDLLSSDTSKAEVVFESIISAKVHNVLSKGRNEGDVPRVPTRFQVLYDGGEWTVLRFERQ